MEPMNTAYSTYPPTNNITTNPGRLPVTRIICPFLMKPLDLWITLQYCSGNVRGSILHYQKEAYQRSLKDPRG